MQNYKKISTFASIMKVNIEKRLSAYHFIALLRRYPLSCCLIIGIWIACFMNVPDTPLSHVTLIDKWTHFTMYGCLCLIIGLEIQKNHRPKQDGLWQQLRRQLVYTWLLPILMSGLIELLQAYCTGGRRSGEWLDFVANAIGATIGTTIGILLARYRANGRRGL